LRIIKLNIAEDCIGQAFIYVAELDKVILREDILFLEKFGSVKLYEFLNPLYIIKKPYFWEVKGLLNTNRIKIIFNRDNLEDVFKEFLLMFT
jgi:hypothetical protein